MRHLALALLCCAVTGGCSESAHPLTPEPAPSRADSRARSVTQNELLPISYSVSVPCAAAGAGEEVQVEGSVHLLTHVTLDARGGFHITQHSQSQGISGVGLVTGDRYQVTGGTQSQFRATAGFTATLVSAFQVTGPGSGNNFLVHQTSHVTVNALGQVTTVVDGFRAACK